MNLGIIRNKTEAGKYFLHGLGHHIGLDVHDRDADTLKKDMVIMIEPGIYSGALRQEMVEHCRTH
jgi:Xaa-Pro aminopeptidase